MQEHSTVCGFSEPMVFTKTVWTKCSAVRYWPSCCTQVLDAWSGFCSAADNGKLYRCLNRCRKLYRCRQLNQDIPELFSLTDQSLFLSLQANSQHVLHCLLPAKSTQPYNLRPRRHSFSLTQTQCSYMMTVISSPVCCFTVSIDCQGRPSQRIHGVGAPPPFLNPKLHTY